MPSKSDLGTEKHCGENSYITITSTSNSLRNIIFKREESHLVTKKSRSIDYTRNSMI